MGLTSLWREYDKDNVFIISPNDKYHEKISASLKIFKDVGIEIQKHTVIVFPDNFKDVTKMEELPASYFYPDIIMLFPLLNEEGVMYQYLHELGHIITGRFPQEIMWAAEIISCSCNFFLFPQDTNCYLNFISPLILPLKQNQKNFQILGEALIKDPGLVYTGNYHIESTLYSYYQLNKDFDFIGLLKSFSGRQTDSALKEEWTNRIKTILTV